MKSAATAATNSAAANPASAAQPKLKRLASANGLQRAPPLSPSAPPPCPPRPRSANDATHDRCVAQITAIRSQEGKWLQRLEELRAQRVKMEHLIKLTAAELQEKQEYVSSTLQQHLRAAVLQGAPLPAAPPPFHASAFLLGALSVSSTYGSGATLPPPPATEAEKRKSVAKGATTTTTATPSRPTSAESTRTTTNTATATVTRDERVMTRQLRQLTRAYLLPDKKKAAAAAAAAAAAQDGSLAQSWAAWSDHSTVVPLEGSATALELLRPSSGGSSSSKRKSGGGSRRPKCPEGVPAETFSKVLTLRERRLRCEEEVEELRRTLQELEGRLQLLLRMEALERYALEASKTGSTSVTRALGPLSRLREMEDEEWVTNITTGKLTVLPSTFPWLPSFPQGPQILTYVPPVVARTRAHTAALAAAAAAARSSASSPTFPEPSSSAAGLLSTTSKASSSSTGNQQQQPPSRRVSQNSAATALPPSDSRSTTTRSNANTTPSAGAGGHK